MEENFVTVKAFKGQDCFYLSLTKNEFKRGQRRYNRYIKVVYKEDIQEKRAMTISNGKCFV